MIKVSIEVHSKNGTLGRRGTGSYYPVSPKYLSNPLPRQHCQGEVPGREGSSVEFLPLEWD